METGVSCVGVEILCNKLLIYFWLGLGFGVYRGPLSVIRWVTRCCGRCLILPGAASYPVFTLERGITALLDLLNLCLLEFIYLDKKSASYTIYVPGL